MPKTQTERRKTVKEMAKMLEENPKELNKVQKIVRNLEVFFKKQKKKVSTSSVDDSVSVFEGAADDKITETKSVIKVEKSLTISDSRKSVFEIKDFTKR